MSTSHAAAPTAEKPRTRRDVATVVVWVVVGGAVLVDLVGLFIVLTGLFPINALMGDTTSHQPLTALPQLIQADPSEGYTSDLTKVSLGLRLLSAAPILVNLGVVGVAGVLILRVIDGIREGAPFAPATLDHWRQLSVTLTVGGVVQTLAAVAAFVGFSAAMSDFESAVTNFGGKFAGLGGGLPDVPWMLFLLGAVATALTMAFRQGAKLQEEAEGVV
jgi:hypothetical protein